MDPLKKAALISLKRSKKDKKSDPSPAIAMSSHEDYGYGTKINLTTEDLDKLGIKELPAVGSEVTITAKAKVTETSKRESDGKTRKEVGLQITHMKLE